MRGKCIPLCMPSSSLGSLLSMWGCFVIKYSVWDAYLHTDGPGLASGLLGSESKHGSMGSTRPGFRCSASCKAVVTLWLCSPFPLRLTKMCNQGTLENGQSLWTTPLVKTTYDTVFRCVQNKKWYIFGLRFYLYSSFFPLEINHILVSSERGNVWPI